MDQEGEEFTPISYAQALKMFEMHLVARFLKTGKEPREISDMLASEQITPTDEVRKLVTALIQEVNSRGAAKIGVRPRSEYFQDEDKTIKLKLVD